MRIKIKMGNEIDQIGSVFRISAIEHAFESDITIMQVNSIGIVE